MVSADSFHSHASDPIGLYLAQLELALAGRNPALIHDALVDAEGHLRAAVAAGASPHQAVEDFGTPEDIARAYVDADHPRRGLPRGDGPGAMPIADPMDGGAAVAGGAAILQSQEPFLLRARRVPVLGIWFHPYAWGSLFFFTTVGFAFALLVFIWVVFMGALSLGTMPIVVGFLLLLLLLGSVRGLCLLDGMLCEFFLGVRMPKRTQPVYTTSGISLWQRLGCWLKDVRSWLSLGYLIGNFPVALVLFVMFVALTAASAALIGAPVGTLFAGSALQFEPGTDVSVQIWNQRYVPDANGEIHIPFLELFLLFVCGLVLATCTLWLARGTGWVYGHVVQLIQVARPRAVLVRPVESAPQ